MLKLDGCYASAEIYETGYPNMTKALNATGRPIVFSCSWPAYIKTVSLSRYLLSLLFCVGWDGRKGVKEGGRERERERERERITLYMEKVVMCTNQPPNS